MAMRFLVSLIAAGVLIGACNTGPAVPPRAKYEHPGLVGELFDRFEGKTKVFLIPDKLAKMEVLSLMTRDSAMTLKSAEGKRIAPTLMGANFSVEGETLRVPATVSMLFMEFRPYAREITSPEARWLADGRAIPSTSSTSSEGGVVEFYGQDFLKLVNAQTIDGRVWGREFQLTESQRAALRDLASRMKPKP